MTENHAVGRKKKIVLDTNFLLIPFQFNVDIFAELDRICDFNYKIYVLDKTIDELKNIEKEQKGLSKKAAAMALQLLAKNRGKVSILNIGKDYAKKQEDMYVDEIILGLEGFIVASTDKALRQRLRLKGRQTISLRAKKTLILS